MRDKTWRHTCLKLRSHQISAALRRAAYCVVLLAVCHNMPHDRRGNGTPSIMHVVKFTYDVRNDVITTLIKSYFAVNICPSLSYTGIRAPVAIESLLYNFACFSLKISPSHVGIWTSCNTWFTGPTRVRNANDNLIVSAVFAGLSTVTD